MKFWYSKTFSARLISYALLPLSALFYLISLLRRLLFKLNVLPAYRAPIPVVVVGNLSVGGNGKTPVTIWLVQQCQQLGLRVGVISRGYGSQSQTFPLLVNENTNPIVGGDEPVLIAKRTGAPVCISPNRQQAIELLLRQQPLDLIISDDGLQHYKLQRDVEIVVIDGERRFGNGFVMPSGPLRELPRRLRSVDLIIANGKMTPESQALMQLVAKQAVNLVSNQARPLSEFEQVNAIAGIGNPARFFTMLQQQGIQLNDYQALQDHQKFSAELLQKFGENQPLFMTEKDAVKCTAFAQPNWWYVPVEAQIDGAAAAQLIDQLAQKCGHFPKSF